MINKIFKKVINKLVYYKYKTFNYNYELILKTENSKMLSLGLDANKAVDKLNSVLESLNLKKYDANNDSVHWKLFSALSISNKNDNLEILEIGTYTGNFTKILSNLFPKANITTVDLPYDDPILRNSYDRKNSDAFSKYVKIQKENIKSNNISLISTNTLFLLDSLKDQKKFDIIWIDGGHLYPEIAWDICQSFYLLKKGGYMLCDDIIKSSKDYKTDYVSSEAFRVLNYLDERHDSKNNYFLKRLDSYRLSNIYTKKYVSLIKK
tara:strand:- start:10725 stop:11519 length:795 start_codon:yes stop_codon:yes gene_type:complete